MPKLKKGSLNSEIVSKNLPIISFLFDQNSYQNGCLPFRLKAKVNNQAVVCILPANCSAVFVNLHSDDKEPMSCYGY